MFGLSNKKSVLGVDIGESSVKLVQLAHLNKHFKLDKFHVEPVPRGLIVEGRVVDVSQVADIIQIALKQNNLSCVSAVASVGYSDVIVKRLRAQKGMRARELEQWVEFEVDKFVPYPMEELSLDFYIDEARSNDAEDELVVTTCRKQAVESVTECLELAGLEPHAIDVSNQALFRAAMAGPEGLSGSTSDLTAIIDVGMSTTRLYVFSGDNMVYHRDEAFGASYLVDGFASHYSLSNDKAHQALYRQRMPKGYKRQVLKPFIKLFLKEIERVMYAFKSSGATGQIARVLLAGGCIQVPEIESIVAKKLRTDVRFMNPMTDLKKAGRLDIKKLNRLAPQLAHACGLAMWEGLT